MSARPLRGFYILFCDGKGCRNTFTGDVPAAQKGALTTARRDAAAIGWLTKYGELCSRCWTKSLEEK